jgi:hypothetical protein
MKNVTLTCLLSHPDLDIEGASAELKLRSYNFQERGKAVVTPRARLSGDTYKESKWWSELEISDRERAEDCLAELVDHLYVSRKYICNISMNGGEVLIFINIPGQERYAMQISPETMKKIADMGIHFGFEVFP